MYYDLLFHYEDRLKKDITFYQMIIEDYIIHNNIIYTHIHIDLIYNV